MPVAAAAAAVGMQRMAVYKMTVRIPVSCPQLLCYSSSAAARTVAAAAVVHSYPAHSWSDCPPRNIRPQQNICLLNWRCCPGFQHCSAHRSHCLLQGHCTHYLGHCSPHRQHWMLQQTHHQNRQKTDHL